MSDKSSDSVKPDPKPGLLARIDPRFKFTTLGLIIGLVISAFAVVGGGAMVDYTNKDTYCASCHEMEPFRTSWMNSVHGGNNAQGVVAQCTYCHLPHVNVAEYLWVKGRSGFSDMYHSIGFEPADFDWAANAEGKREHFVYDSACRVCHEQLVSPGISFGAMSAHREYLNGATEKKCASCHPHVGHRDMLEEVQRCFSE